MADQDVTEMTEDTAPSPSDLEYGVKDPAGTPLDRRLTRETVRKMYLPAGRNELINGCFTIWQEGQTITGASTPANSDDTYVADQWILLSDGNDIVDVTRDSSAPPTGSQYNLKAEVETANKKFGFLQIIEAANSIPLTGKSVSLSFQVKGTLDNCRAVILAWDGAADTVTSDVISAWAIEGTNPTWAANWTAENTPANLAIGAGWATHEIENISIDTSGMTNVAVFIWVDDTDGAVDEVIELGQVKLEVNPTCTAFEHDRIEELIAKCERHFCKTYNIDVAPGTITTVGCIHTKKVGANTTVIGMNPWWSVRMRITPTIVCYSVDTGAADKIYNSTDDGDVDVIIDFLGQIKCRIRLSAGTADLDEYRAQVTASARL